MRTEMPAMTAIYTVYAPEGWRSMAAITTVQNGGVGGGGWSGRGYLAEQPPVEPEDDVRGEVRRELAEQLGLVVDRVRVRHREVLDDTRAVLCVVCTASSKRKAQNSKLKAQSAKRKAQSAKRTAQSSKLKAQSSKLKAQSAPLPMAPRKAADD